MRASDSRHLERCPRPNRPWQPTARARQNCQRVWTRALCRVGVVGLAALAGCASTAPHDTAVPGGLCHTQGQGLRQRSTCTQVPVPGAAQAAVLRQLPADPQRLTVVLVRRHWADTRDRVDVAAGGASVQTVPQSFAVLQLPPGPQALHLRWAGGHITQALDGRAGQVLAFDLDGLAVAGHSQFTLTPLTEGRAAAHLAHVAFAGVARP